jgi:phosphoglycolate phosphatase-like HAD superfamily hydrolase
VLVLFDIDGTLLLGAAEAHREAIFAALHAVHGVDPGRVRGTVATAGRTDGEIARAILLRSGVSAAQIDERADDVRDACCRAYAQLATDDLSHTVLPGITELLAWLAARDDVALALVTGNYEPVARLKLRRAGIGRFFPTGQGAFGSDSEDRAALPPIARRRAGAGGVTHPRDQTIVIGDTPHDIACAHADGLRCLAVSTGPCNAGELGDADGLAADADQLRRLLEEAFARAVRL